jgi:ABC-2 type transport system permease protein
VFASTLTFVLLPLLLLSGVLLPLTLAPDWMQPATLNLFSYAVDAALALCDASVLYGFGVMAVLALLALWWAARSFRRVAA